MGNLKMSVSFVDIRRHFQLHCPLNLHAPLSFLGCALVLGVGKATVDVDAVTSAYAMDSPFAHFLSNINVFRHTRTQRCCAANWTVEHDRYLCARRPLYAGKPTNRSACSDTFNSLARTSFLRALPPSSVFLNYAIARGTLGNRALSQRPTSSPS